MKIIQDILEVLTMLNTEGKYAYLDREGCVRSEEIINLIKQLEEISK